MTSLKMLSSDEKLTEIRSLYFNATKQSIQQDIAKALDLLKSMPSEDERERATVYMEGLAEMQRDWFREPKARSGKPKGGGKKPAPGSGARPRGKNAGPGAKGANTGAASGAPKGGAQKAKTGLPSAAPGRRSDRGDRDRQS